MLRGVSKSTASGNRVMNNEVERIRKGLMKTMKSSVLIDGVAAEPRTRHLPIANL